MANYVEAPEVENIAKDLIKSYHEHLINARIAYLFRDKTSTKGGKEVWGKTSRVAGKYKALTGCDFVVEVAKDVWDRRLSPEQKEALVDHELSHCGMDVDGNYIIYEHDFEGFTDVLKRHGYWADDLKILNRTVQQLEMPLAVVNQ